MTTTTIAGALYVILPAIALLLAPSAMALVGRAHAALRALNTWLLTTRLHALSCRAAALVATLHPIATLQRLVTPVRAMVDHPMVNRAAYVLAVLALRVHR